MAMIKGTHRPSGTIPTSSMADIAFLLLVFFLVTTVFPKQDGLALVLPHESVEVAGDNVLHLIVQPRGMVEVRLGESAQSQVISTPQVGSFWRGMVASNPHLIAAVKVDPDAPYRRMIDVLDQLLGVGAERVSLQVLPR